MHSCINFTIFLIFALFFCKAQTNDGVKLKSSVIEEIVQKVGNITLNSLINAQPEAKSTIMDNIEHKLIKSAFSFGEDRKKYIKFIMQGIKQMSSTNSKIDGSEIRHDLRSTHIGDTTNQTELHNDESKAKEQAIKNIAEKIEILAKKYLKKAKTPEDKKAIIENIKRKVMDSANRKHMKIHSKHNEIKSYRNLIAKGIELMIERNKENDARRMDVELVDNINDKKDTDDHPTTNEPISTVLTITSEVIFDKLECDTLTKDTCSSAKSLNKFTCRLDNKILPLEKLCDGVSDCLDQSDEQDCTIQAINKIQSAGRIISNVESSLSRKCFTADVTEPFLSKQNQVLLGVLNAQLKFIQKYTNTSSYPNINDNDLNKNTLKKTTNEVALVVSSLARALDASLCARRFGTEDNDEVNKKYLDNSADEAFEDIRNERMWSPKSCGCSGPLCMNSSCSNLCKRVCWQKHSLDRWTCHAVDNGPSVSLDVICDGKLDCYDESDEQGCSIEISSTKFEAVNIYEDILKQIATKARIKENNWILKELLALHDSIKLLQKLSTKRNVEAMNVKIVREQCFQGINVIYDKFLHNGRTWQINDIYSFLISLIEKLVRAMKRSGTGNEKIISSTDGKCFCTGSRCGLPKCSQICIKVCAVEPTLTKYACDNSKLNATLVPIEAVCNGKSNCPNGEDEEGCMKDICRAYHLRVLRHNIQDVGLKQKGTSLGEVLKSWKTKVTSILKVAETNDRPTHRVLKDIIGTILHDLSTSYATIEEFRRSSNRSEHALKEFARISQLVIEALKSCGH